MVFDNVTSIAMRTNYSPRVLRKRKSRGRGLRTTSGCMTCRKRHIKCDESKPVCGPCVRKDKSCYYASDGPGSDVTDSATIQQHSPREPEPEPEPQQQPAEGTADDPVPEKQQDAISWENHETEPIAHQSPVLEELPEIEPPEIEPPAIEAPAPGQSPISLRSNHFSPQEAPFGTYSVHTGSIPSPGLNINSATFRWFGLLAGDAARETPDLSTSFFGYGNECISIERVEDADQIQPSSLQRATQVLDCHPPDVCSPNAGHLDGDPLEKQLWQAHEPIELLPREHFLFENFVQHVSQWIDLFDPTSQFSTFVPHLAMRNAGLLNAILALSCRHLSLNPRLDEIVVPNGEAVLQYYYQTLHYVQKAMQYSSYKTSLELLATTLIISAYEMLDNSTNDWERHLEGVFLIQRSQIIHGESGGLHAAIWWAWLCQDVWAAFREKRKTLTFWIPTKPLASLSPHELAARSVYIMAKVVSFCAQKGSNADEDIQSKVDRANYLRGMLDDWREHLTIEFSPLPLLSDDYSTFFRPIWIRPPAFAVAVQLHCAARILLLAHEPSLGGLNSYRERHIIIQRCVENICGIAMALKDGASSLMSSQMLFIAGMFTHDRRARDAVLELLDSCRERNSWPVKPLGDELRQLWMSPAPAGPFEYLYP